MVARQDIDASGNVFKQTLTKPKKGEYELPGDNDELQFKLAFYQDRGDAFAPYQGLENFKYLPFN